MSKTFHERLEDFIQASRTSAYGTADAALAELLRACGDTATLLHRWAQLDLAAEEFAQAEEKIRAVCLLKPDAVWARRELAFVLTLRGRVEQALPLLERFEAELRQSDELIWLVEAYLRLREIDRAAAVVARARQSGQFPAADVLAAEGCIALNLGRSIEAERLSRDAASAQPPSRQGLRQLAILAEQRWQVLEAAAAWSNAAVVSGNNGELRLAVEQYRLLFRFEDALRVIVAVSAKWPDCAEACAALYDDVLAQQESCAEALHDCGSLKPFDRSRILRGLTEAATPAEMLWAKQAVIALVEDQEFTAADAELLLSLPWLNWEDLRVRAFFARQAVRRFPDSIVLQRLYLRLLLSGSPLLWADAREALCEIPQEQWDADIVFMTLYLLAGEVVDRAAGTEGSRSSVIRARIAETLPSAPASFLLMARRPLACMGFPPPKALPLPGDEPTRRAVQKFAGFGDALWTNVWHTPLGRRAGEPNPIVVLSGQLRGFVQAWPTIFEQVVQPLRASVIMSVWDNTQNARGRHAHRLARVLPRDILKQLPAEEQFDDAFEQRYPETAALLFGTQTVDARDLHAIVESSGVRRVYVETESEATFDAVVRNERLDKNLMKMFAKMARLEELIREDEARAGRLFTHVLWVRPDVQLFRVVPRELSRWVEGDDTAWSTFCSPWAFGDHFIAVPRPAFSMIGRIFPSLALGEHMDFLAWRPTRSGNSIGEDDNLFLMGPETLADSLFAAGLATRAMQGLAYRLIGSAPPPAQVREVFLREQNSG